MTVEPACKRGRAHGGAEHGLVPDVLSLEDLLPFRAVLLREDRVDHGNLFRPDRTLDARVFEACADDAAETLGATQLLKH